MADWKLLDREQRGMILAATAKIVQRGKNWIVPSQSGDGTKYVVDESSPPRVPAPITPCGVPSANT